MTSSFRIELAMSEVKGACSDATEDPRTTLRALTPSHIQKEAGIPGENQQFLVETKSTPPDTPSLHMQSVNLTENIVFLLQ
jgi:hypothetical protein